MHRRSFVLACAAFAAACSRQQQPAPAADQGPDPSAVIAPLYQPYIANGVMPGLADQAPWSDELRDQLVAMMARSQATNEPILDFDPIIGAQDYQISALSLTTDALVPQSHAVVRAHFSNLGRDTEVFYDMIWQHEGWRVDNMRGDGWDLRQVIAAPPTP